MRRCGRDPPRFDLTEANVFLYRQVITDEVLENHADLLAQRQRIDVAEIYPVDQDRAFGRIVEPAQELDQGRLTGAVVAHQRKLLARTDDEIHAAQRPCVLVRIAKADFAKLDAARGAGDLGLAIANCGVMLKLEELT
jgi:hypothetical protein